jgi:hypothetical protein
MRTCWHSFGSKSQTNDGRRLNTAGSQGIGAGFAALKECSFLTVLNVGIHMGYAVILVTTVILVLIGGRLYPQLGV